MNKIFSWLDGAFRAYCVYPFAEYVQKREIISKLRILRKEALRPFPERRKLALERLAKVLEMAQTSIPFYRDSFAKSGFTLEKFRKDEKYFQDIPFMDKETIREQGKRLINPDFRDKIVREQKTGGSTGLSAIIYYDQESLDWTAAQNILMLAWGGKKRTDREAHLSTRFPNAGRPVFPDLEAKKCFVLNRYNIYTKSFGEADQKQLLEDLATAKARVIQGHPSSMFELARYVTKNNIPARGLFEIFVSTGEMLRDEPRRLIEQAFGTRVSNRYGACEFGVMAQEKHDNPGNDLLVHDAMVWPEIYGPDASGVGELVFTNLRNPAMPLIRYRMGDLGKLETRPDGWWITRLEGRIHDTVMLNNQPCPTHFIQDMLDRCGNISDFQIVVKDNLPIELRLVVKEEEWAKTARAVAANLPGVPLRRIEPEDLEFTGQRGKFSYLLRAGQ